MITLYLEQLNPAELISPAGFYFVYVTVKIRVLLIRGEVRIDIFKH
jgi:hypothetical protein